MTTPNAPLMRKTMEHIEANPQGWFQESYRCGTGMCFAGWAVELDGGQWVSADPGDHGPHEGFDVRDMLVADDTDPAEHIGTLPDGTRVVLAQERAQRILGLTDERADLLFVPFNLLEDLRSLVRDFCG